MPCMLTMGNQSPAIARPLSATHPLATTLPATAMHPQFPHG